MWKRIATVGASAGTLVAVSLIGAAPASASSTHYATNPDGQSHAGLGQFASVGEWFYACDELADGYGVKVDWHVVDNPSNNGSAWAQGGSGSCDSSNATIAEGKAVDYRICFTKNGAEVSCTGYFRDYA
ncbi:MAG: hypothetical protein ACJ74U_09945 [Jatrophihabitantaceae bacterium]